MTAGAPSGCGTTDISGVALDNSMKEEDSMYARPSSECGLQLSRTTCSIQNGLTLESRLREGLSNYTILHLLYTNRPLPRFWPSSLLTFHSKDFSFEIPTCFILFSIKSTSLSYITLTLSHRRRNHRRWSTTGKVSDKNNDCGNVVAMSVYLAYRR